MSVPTVVTPPTFEPVTVAEVVEALILNDVDDQVHIQRCISAARGYCERYIGFKLPAQTLAIRFNYFTNFEFYLPLTQLVRVVDISYIDVNENEQTLAPAIYGVDGSTDPALVYLKNNQSWPDVYDERNSVTVTYIAGYETADDIPAEIKMAIIAIVGGMLENREAQQSRAIYENPTVESLLYQFRVHPV